MIIEVLKEQLIADDGEKVASKVKSSFWASETETPLFDLYHKWKGTAPTNPSTIDGLLIMNTGKMVELSLVDILKKKKMLVEQTPNQQINEMLGKEITQDRVEFNLKEYKISVSGYIDAQLSDGSILEIKSYYGDYQERDFENGKPKTSHLKQLAVYMYHKQVNTGYLVYINRGTGKMYEFTLIKKDTKFYLVVRKNEIGEIEEAKEMFDLKDTFERWSSLLINHIIPNIEPESEFRYKIPLNEIDWNTISKADICKARNNQKVIGDSWQVAYSPYKDLIIAKEALRYGKTLEEYIGYNEEELEIIRAETKGYSSIKK